MDTPLLSYVVGAGIIGLVIGGFIGAIVRGARARRQAQRAASEVESLREQLAAAARTFPPTQQVASPPQRWTGTEVAAVVAAAATFIGSIGAVYVNLRGGELKELREQLQESSQKLQAGEAERIRIATKVKSVLGTELQRLLDMPEAVEMPATKSKKPTEFRVDNLTLQGICNNKRLLLTYSSVGPAILHCKRGSALLSFEKPVRLLIAPELRPD